jgi:hypothetical protein
MGTIFLLSAQSSLDSGLGFLWSQVIDRGRAALELRAPRQPRTAA